MLTYCNYHLFRCSLVSKLFSTIPHPPTHTHTPVRYKVVSYPMAAHIEPTPKNCTQIVRQAGLENWAIGRTKVFLKYFHVERLTQIMDNYHKAATQMEKSEWLGTLALHKHFHCFVCVLCVRAWVCMSVSMQPCVHVCICNTYIRMYYRYIHACVPSVHGCTSQCTIVFIPVQWYEAS